MGINQSFSSLSVCETQLPMYITEDRLNNQHLTLPVLSLVRALQWEWLVPRARLYSVCDVISDSESSAEEVIYTSQEAEMKSVIADDVLKDIMGRDNDNKETSVIIENSNDGKLLLVTLKR